MDKRDGWDPKVCGSRSGREGAPWPDSMPAIPGGQDELPFRAVSRGNTSQRVIYKFCAPGGLSSACQSAGALACLAGGLGRPLGDT